MATIRSLSIALAVSATCLLGCATEADLGAPSDPELEEAEAGSGNSVTYWTTIGTDAITRPVEESTSLRSGAVSLAQWTMVSLAMYDALVAIDDDYEEFSYDENFYGDDDSEVKDAAVATAAYRILRTRVPGRAAFLDTTYANYMATLPADDDVEDGVALGEDVAAHYLALRANDNLDKTVTYVQPPTGPGVFEPTTASAPAEQLLTIVPPYTLSSKSAWYAPGPRALSSSEYASSWKEVRDYGRVDSTVRTQAQKEIALFWGEHGLRFWNRNLVNLAIAKGLGRMSSARLIAMASLASSESTIVHYSAKYHFYFWRPFHSIPRADTDGNDATTADPTWTPLLNVNHPEYPSGHAVWSPPVVDAVRKFFGTNSVTWTLTTTVAGAPPSRTFTSLESIVTDMVNARIWAGLHYRFTMNDSVVAGRKISSRILYYYFRHDDD